MALGSPAAEADDGRGKQSQTYTTIALLLIAIGAAARLAHLLADRSLWLDEAMLALNIVSRSFAALLQPLDYAQGAPLGFLMLEKLAVTLWGPNETALRCVPFLAALGALVAFHFLAQRVLPRRDALLALALFALSPALVYYAAEVKQYALDACCTTLVLLTALQVDAHPQRHSAGALFAALGAIAVWLSHPAVFVLAGAGTYLIVRRWRAGDRPGVTRMIVIAVVWSISFAIDVGISLQHLAANRFLLGYWQAGFPPLPTSLAALLWYPTAAGELLSLGLIAPFSTEHAPVAIVAWVAAGLGACWCYRHPWSAFLLLSPIVVAFAAAVVGVYPFAGRLLLFAIPIVVLILAAGAGVAWRPTERSGASAGVLVAAALLIVTSINLVRWLAAPQKEDIRHVLATMHPHLAPRDVIYVHNRAAHAFAYYTSVTQRFSMGDATLVQGQARQKDEAEWAAAEVQGLLGRRRVWTVFSGRWSWSPRDQEVLLATLAAHGRKLEEYTATGATASLWDLGDQRAGVVPSN